VARCAELTVLARGRYLGEEILVQIALRVLKGLSLALLTLDLSVDFVDDASCLYKKRCLWQNEDGIMHRARERIPIAPERLDKREDAIAHHA